MNVALTPRDEATPRCAICHDDAQDAPLLCPGCSTLVHAECRAGARCPTLGCVHGRRPATAGAPRERIVLLRAPLVGWLSAAARRVGREARLAALVVVALLAAAGAGAIHSELGASSRARVQADQETILQAAALFRLHRGRRALNVEELVGAYLQEEPRDPWGQPYQFDGELVTCLGPDGLRGTRDDLRQAGPWSDRPWSR